MNESWIWAGHKGLEVCICCKAMRTAGHYGDCELASLRTENKRLREALREIRDHGEAYAASLARKALADAALRTTPGGPELAAGPGMDCGGRRSIDSGDKWWRDGMGFCSEPCYGAGRHVQPAHPVETSHVPECCCSRCDAKREPSETCPTCKGTRKCQCVTCVKQGWTTGLCGDCAGTGRTPAPSGEGR